VADPDDDFPYPSVLDVASWRREVHALYAAVRAEPDPVTAHGLWVDTRSRLFLEHPASPRREGQQLRHAPYDPAYRFVVEVQPVGDDDRRPQEPWDFRSATDGAVPFTGAGRVTLDGLGTLDVWWLNSYGGGIFLPVRDGSAGRETYGAGRYLLDTVKGTDLGRDGEGRWVVDLNFAYNPSCVYDYRWVCPLAPAANRIEPSTPVGELLPDGY
jgi:uncharacterized protein (DUF1684 family)